MIDADRERMSRTRQTIEAVLRRQFGRLNMVSLDVKEMRDHDGDPILWITVVYDPEGTELEASKRSGLVRHLRPALAEHGEERFPVMSFVDAEEYAEAG